MDKFIINDCGVCLNPSFDDVYKNKNFSIKVSYACHKSHWAFGINIQYNHPQIGHGGCSYSPSFNEPSETFKSKQLCEKAAFKSLLSSIEMFRNKAVVFPLVEAVKAHFMATQLTLF